MRDVTLTLRLSNPGTGQRTEFNCDLHTAEIVPTAGDEVSYSTLCASVPPSATAPGMTGQVTLIAGNYGGEVDTYPELEVEMPCTSKPTKIVTTFPALDEESAEEPAGETVAA
jgi:hypothetical protein